MHGPGHTANPRREIAASNAWHPSPVDNAEDAQPPRVSGSIEAVEARFPDEVSQLDLRGRDTAASVSDQGRQWHRPVVRRQQSRDAGQRAVPGGKNRSMGATLTSPRTPLSPGYDPQGHRWIERILADLRAQLRMEVAFVSEFRGGRRIFRYVDAEPSHTAVRVGGSDPLEASYCQRVIDGRLPEVIPDATRIPECLSLPATLALPVGAHISVPIYRADGSVYGTFCCFSSEPDPSLKDRDAALLRILAPLIGDYLENEGIDTARRGEIFDRTRRILDAGGPDIVFQPIKHLASGATCGYEALSRFPSSAGLPPDVWFLEAAEVGLGVELELAAISAALRRLPDIARDAYLSVNASTTAIMSADFFGVISRAPCARVVLELTEHAAVDDYVGLNAALLTYRSAGLRIAVDDTGAGYASMSHILQLHPDIIKLDRSLTLGIAEDRARQAMATFLVSFSREIGAHVLAEGIETEHHLSILLSLGVQFGQGYHLGRPGPLEHPASSPRVAVAALRRASSAHR